MKTSSKIALILGVMVALAPAYSWSQTSLGEVNATLRMQDELNSVGGGPSMGGVSRPAPPPGPGSAPGPSVSRSPAPESSGGPISAPAAPPAPAVGGPKRVVKAPENGFVPTFAAQQANIGFEYMHDMRFDEAIEAYRRAMENDDRYQGAYQGMLQAVNQIKQFGTDTVGQIVLTEQPVKVTLAEYFGWGG
jgi:hypothetical protein